uniref:ribosomal protein S3 n=1 Tax=Ulva meridionalis TaxID=434723 RepID=UPI002113D2DC|nr:ribosomal protein S3 [Ulva meridionalis]UTA96529.1 ribosomal protein S3 [Ulva meridionalis]UTA96587.1 ribosomal protein S3 [Ulva meridionalis]UTA96639.1 ribosomal protein S3 [Ulva meridionalis]UTA96691.1 ribosomal protein S3 [Ulva meridionalis]UTA96754.1 ribosomal protein S3 [Ulva meridionalis]
MSKILNQSLKKKSALIEYSFTKVYNSRNLGISSKIKPAVIIYILASNFAFDLSNLQTIYLEKKIIQSAFKHQFNLESGGFYKLQTTQFVLHCLKTGDCFKENSVYQQNLFRPIGQTTSNPQLIFSNNNPTLLESKHNQFKNRLIYKGSLIISREEAYKITQSKKQNLLGQVQWNLFYASNLMCANWILNQIVQLLSNSDKKSPRPIVNQYINDIRILIRSMGSTCPIFGVRITITGRLGSQKKAMAQQISKCVGKVPLSTLRQNIGYSQGFVRTRFGVIGVSVWVCYK